MKSVQEAGGGSTEKAPGRGLFRKVTAVTLNRINSVVEPPPYLFMSLKLFFLDLEAFFDKEVKRHKGEN